jgi:hypothetical protein
MVGDKNFAYSLQFTIMLLHSNHQQENERELTVRSEH